MSKNEQIKRMADLLRSGATMLEEHCPECSSPLFKVKGEVYCSKCNKRVLIVKEGEEPFLEAQLLLKDVEKTICLKIQIINKKIEDEENITNLESLTELLLKWLDALKKVKEIQRI